MKIPTHLLAIEVVPGLDSDPHQPPLPGMPSLPHRVRVHRVFLTTEGFRDTPDGPRLGALVMDPEIKKGGSPRV